MENSTKLESLSNTNKAIHNKARNAYGDYWSCYPIKYKECWGYTNDDYFFRVINSDVNDFIPFETKDGVFNLLEYLKILNKNNTINSIDFLFMKIPSGQINLNLHRLKSLIIDEFKVNFFDYISNIIKIIKFVNPLIIYLEVGIECFEYILNILAKNSIILLDSFKVNKTQKLLRLTNQKDYLEKHVDDIFLNKGSLDNIRNEVYYHSVNKNELSKITSLNKTNRDFNLESLLLKDVSLLQFSDKIKDSKSNNNTFNILDLSTDLGTWGRIAYKYKCNYIGIELNQRKLANFIAFLDERKIKLEKL